MAAAAAERKRVFGLLQLQNVDFDLQTAEQFQYKRQYIF